MSLGILPVSADPVSAVAIIGLGAVVWWARREVKRLDCRIDKHDGYNKDTHDDLSQIRVDVAGIQSSMASMDTRIGDSMNSITTRLSDIAKDNRDIVKYMLTNGNGK